MSCKTLVNYECVTKIGDTFVGSKYDFTFEIGEAVITDLRIEFSHPNFGVVPELVYTVGDGITKVVNVYTMANKPTVGLQPGVYRYKVIATYDNNNIETIIEGLKSFEL
jgi:hypothetical protein